MGTALAIVVVLALLAKGGSQSQQDQGGGHQPPPEPNGGGPLQDVIDTGVKLAGLVGGGTGLGLLGTGGTAAAGGGGTAAVGGGATLGGSGGGSGAVGGAGGAGGGIGAGAAGTVGSLEGAIGACGITLIVIIIIICNEIAKGQAEHKSFQSRLLAFLPNARDMHAIEAAIVEGALGSMNRQTFEVRDFRLDRRDDGNKITFQGYRKVIRWIPPPAGSGFTQNLHRRARAFAYAQLRERSRRGRAINASWQHMNVPVWADPDQDMAFREAMNKSTVFGVEGAARPELGGLASVPLIWGLTVAPRTDASDPYPASAELVARPEDRNVDEEELPVEERKLARLFGVLDAIKLFHHDPTVYIAFDGREYRDTMLTRLGLNSREATAMTRIDSGDANPQRHGFMLKAEEFGINLWVDAVRVKSGGWGLGGVGVSNPHPRPALEVMPKAAA